MSGIRRLLTGLALVMTTLSTPPMLPASAANPRMTVEILICRLGIQCASRDGENPDRAAVELSGSFPQLAGSPVKVRLYDSETRKIYPEFDQSVPLDGKGRLVVSLPVYRLGTGKYGIAVAAATDSNRLIGEALVIVSRGALKPPGMPPAPAGMPRR